MYRLFFTSALLIMMSIMALPSAEAGSFTHGLNQDEFIGAGHTEEFRVGFRRGQVAEVLFSIQDRADLDIYVYDSRGRLVAYDERRHSRNTHFCWTPRRTGFYRIRVVNRSDRASSYYICTN